MAFGRAATTAGQQLEALVEPGGLMRILVTNDSTQRAA